MKLRSGSSARAGFKNLARYLASTLVMNNLKTFFLLTLLTLIAIGVGDYFGGQNGMILGFIFAGVTNFISYFFSDKIALAMYRAQPVTREQLPRIYTVVEQLTQKASLPMPKLYVIPTDSPNAFATGRSPNHASVAVTQGILSLLDDEELEGVLAHELGHVRNRDILTSSIAATLAGAITVLARMGMFFGFGGDRDRDRGGGILMLLLAPFAAMLIQLWVSRTREYEADATGAGITHNPYALARALQKLDAYSKRVPMVASPSTAHLFIIQPLMGMNFGKSVLHASAHLQADRKINGATGGISIKRGYPIFRTPLPNFGGGVFI